MEQKKQVAILVVEDEVLVAEDIRIALQKMGYQYAAERCTSRHFHVIFVRNIYWLSGLSGLYTCFHMRRVSC